MNISLTAHFDDFVQNQVKSGHYHSASEVIREALRLLEEQKAMKKAQIDYMRGELQKGVESGTSKEWNTEDFLTKAREKAGLKT